MSQNRLASAPSAYLRSAAHQPIHWYAWSPDAFAAAGAADRPILLDIGAVWCHWCHVMDRESYEDPRLAEFLNEHFVCIKVDRDERPDVDARYQRAVQVLTQQGGWPLTAFLTPAGQVFYGGTYFPPDGRYGRPGFRAVLQSVLDAYHGRREQIEAQALAIRRIVDQALDDAVPGELSAAPIEAAERHMARAFDARHGGFGTQPKFPNPAALLLLMHRWCDRPDDGQRRIVELTLRGMARGGIHDHLGGGFHRYSVDAEWIVPHFEKMSYDNSELLRVYGDGYALFGDEEAAAAARGIVRWVREVLADPAGGYGASQDADVGLDDDGDYFTWTRDEAALVLDPDELAIAAARYDIGTAGEMHHNPAKNVLFAAETVPAIAARTGRPPDDVARTLARAEEKLRAARAERPAPFVDRTRYAAWNAMMASALLRASAVLDDAWAREHALLSLRRLRAESVEPDALAHAPGGVGGLLEDQVFAAAAALDAYEATGDADWLGWARALMERVGRDYRDAASGSLLDVARDRAGEGLLPAPSKSIQDSPTPSANGAAALVYARLHELTGAESWRERQAEILRAFAGHGDDLGLHASTYLLALDRYLSPPTHLAIVAEPGDRVGDDMHRAALATFFPRRTVVRVAPGADRAALPQAVRGMLDAPGGWPRGYLCVGTTCDAPALGLAAWRAALDARRPGRVSPPEPAG